MRACLNKFWSRLLVWLSMFLAFSCQDPAVAVSTPIELSVPVTEVVVRDFTSGGVFALSWNDAECEKYHIQFSLSADFGFYYELTTTRAAYSVSGAEMRLIASTLGAVSSFSSYVRVVGESTYDPVRSDAVCIDFVYDLSYDISTLYVCGEACDSGWSMLDDEINRMTGADGKYFWSGHLEADKEFRFNTKVGAWFPAIVLRKGTAEAVYIEDWDETLYEQFKVSQSGLYVVNLDISDMNQIDVQFLLQ